MKKKRLLAVTVLVIALLFGGYRAYVSVFYHADDMIDSVFSQLPADLRREERDNVLYFIPDHPTHGLIFYPGAKVQCEAYIPLLTRCAEKGILCALVRMPDNLAVLNFNAASPIIAAYPTIDSWYLAGHSLGGAVGATYAARHADKLDGLILLAAYSTSDLSASPLRVLSIYGSEDGVLDMDNYRKNFSHLPADCTEIIIDGGCHAYFGYYGPQNGDGTPTVSHEEQIDITVDAIFALIGV